MIKKNLKTLLVVAVGSLALASGAMAAKVTGTSSSTSSGLVENEKDPSLHLINLNVAPIAIAFGGLGAHLDFGIGESTTLGPTFSYQRASAGFGDFAETKVGIYEIGARANFYMGGRRFSNGFVLGPYLSYMPATVTQKSMGRESSGSVSGISAGALASYQWVWSSGINMTAGGGLAYYSLPSDATVASTDGSKEKVSVPGFTGVLPNIELTMGYVF